ncbi:MAG: hypothetical protein HQ501_05130 [Rhodospirillales bacterium]|nr:hypothetical protein [Rhodospirillales bacterium]
MTVFYHSTDGESAEQILLGGFRDSTGNYMLANTVVTGIFVANIPLGVQDGAAGDVTLKISTQLPIDTFSEFELVEEMKPFREWCIPADRINGSGQVCRMTEDEVDAVLDRT